jgi:predicted metal-dependent HD superfamily phosphohydrolase
VAILIDPPRWPAHGTVFSHLVSDTSLEELHAFAAVAGIPARAFDHDHYDVAMRRYRDLVALGAEEVSANNLIRRLVASGLRVRTAERTRKRHEVIPWLERAWRELLPDQHWLGEELLLRWAEPHRHYHDVRHLGQCLDALNRIETEEPVADAVRLAAWFHDAVYDGNPGVDEEASAELAEQLLPQAGIGAATVEEVARLVRLTVEHAPEPHDRAGAQLIDADLSILAESRARYDYYVREVRLDFEHVADDDFRRGRLAALEHLLRLEPLFHTSTGRRLWAEAARHNLEAERRRWWNHPAAG